MGSVGIQTTFRNSISSSSFTSSPTSGTSPNPHCERFSKPVAENPKRQNFSSLSTRNLLRRTSSVIGRVTPCMVRSPSRTPVVSEVRRSRLLTNFISGKRCTLKKCFAFQHAIELGHVGVDCPRVHGNRNRTLLGILRIVIQLARKLIEPRVRVRKTNMAVGKIDVRVQIVAFVESTWHIRESVMILVCLCSTGRRKNECSERCDKSSPDHRTATIDSELSIACER